MRWLSDMIYQFRMGETREETERFLAQLEEEKIPVSIFPEEVERIRKLAQALPFSFARECLEEVSADNVRRLSKKLQMSLGAAHSERGEGKALGVTITKGELESLESNLRSFPAQARTYGMFDVMDILYRRLGEELANRGKGDMRVWVEETPPAPPSAPKALPPAPPEA